MRLTAEQQGQVLGILSVACDRETAAGFVDCTAAEIAQAMQFDPAFNTIVRRTEAAAELTCMRTLHQAAKDAFDEMGLLRWRFPAESPYTIDQILDEAFWPEA